VGSAPIATGLATKPWLLGTRPAIAAFDFPVSARRAAWHRPPAQAELIIRQFVIAKAGRNGILVADARQDQQTTG
jgi:hypothetical protein